MTDLSNPVLWKYFVDQVKAGDKGGNKGEWSARKAQLAVALYKKAGGGYTSPKHETSLSRWTEQNWRTKSGKPSLETGERYLPAAAIAALSPSEYKRTSAAKRKGMKKGEQFVKQPSEIAQKVKKYRE